MFSALYVASLFHALLLLQEAEKSKNGSRLSLLIVLLVLGLGALYVIVKIRRDQKFTQNQLSPRSRPVAPDPVADLSEPSPVRSQEAAPEPVDPETLFPKIVELEEFAQVDPETVARYIALSARTKFFPADVFDAVANSFLSQRALGEFDYEGVTAYLDALCVPAGLWTWTPLRKSDMRSEDLFVDLDDEAEDPAQINGKVYQGYYTGMIPLPLWELIADFEDSCAGHLLTYVSVITRDQDSDTGDSSDQAPHFLVVTLEEDSALFVLGFWRGDDENSLVLSKLPSPPLVTDTASHG